jgi:hypothetical protein
MGIREKLNNNPKAAIGIGAVAIALGVVFIALQLSSHGGGPSDRAYFSTDDGQRWFVDDADKIPPFPHDGKEAVRAHVFHCNGKEFVNHLERYTPERRKLMEATAEAERAGKPPPAPPPAAGRTVMWGQEFKKPGAKEWVPAGNLARTGPLLQAKCPDGGEAVPVVP